MIGKYNKACTEILEILKYLPKHEYEKIPKDEIDFFEQNKDKSYIFKFNEELSFEEQSILPETQAIIVKLYKDYFYLKDSKTNKDRKVHTDIELDQSKPDNEKYSEIFGNKLKKDTTNISNVVNTEKMLQVNRKKWYTILFGMFKRK